MASYNKLCGLDPPCNNCKMCEDAEQERRYLEQSVPVDPKLPNVHWVCGRNMNFEGWEVGVYWCKRKRALAGELIYEKRFVIKLIWRFDMWLDRK